MKKIPTLFERLHIGNRQVFDKVVPEAQWVADGEGIATTKWDGTACLVRGGNLYKRYTLKPGRTAPPDFEPSTDPDPNTGKQEGWVPVGDGAEDKYHREAFQPSLHLVDGTYELLGPKIQGNPEDVPTHRLRLHGSELLPDAPRTFDALKDYLASHSIEGIVWHHPDGRMAKIKGRDFGIRRRQQ